VRKQTPSNKSANWLGLIVLGAVLTAFAPAAAGKGKGAGPRLGPITVVEIVIPDRAALDDLVRAGYDIDGVRGDRVRIHADSDELAALRADGYRVAVSAAPALVPSAVAGLGSYNNYSNVTAMLNGYAVSNAAVCRLVSLGKSVQNRDLWAMKITSNPDTAADKPEFAYIGAIHGDESVGMEMCLYFIDDLLGRYRTNDTRIANLINTTEIWVVPVMNPDGLENNARDNANGYDLNRSFPEGSATNLGNFCYGPTLATNGLQPEVRHIMTWTAAHSLSLAANFHTGSLVVNYPYDNDNLGSVSSPSPDELLFQDLSRTYSSNNIPMWESKSFSDGIVNGAAWYAISGGMQDWNYRCAGNNEVTIELSDIYKPPASKLPALWSDNREAMLQYLERVHCGVRGILRDAESGLPVAGAVRVEGFHHLVFSDPAVDDYHRLLLPGTYTLWFYAPGYIPQRITGVVVAGGPATRLDVALQPVSSRFAAKISFQPSAVPVPQNYLADTGAVFGVRSGGFSYGWDTSRAAQTTVRWAGRSQDLRYDTSTQMQSGGNATWEIAVPNGPYSVLVAAGDAAVASNST